MACQNLIDILGAFHPPHLGAHLSTTHTHLPSHRGINQNTPLSSGQHGDILVSKKPIEGGVHSTGTFGEKEYQGDIKESMRRVHFEIKVPEVFQIRYDFASTGSFYVLSCD